LAEDICRIAEATAGIRRLAQDLKGDAEALTGRR
jgi:hypothetical protein